MGRMLPCPACASDDTQVVDSRARTEGEQHIYRRRKCRRCGAKFSTRESYVREEAEKSLPELVGDLLKLAVSMNAKAIGSPSPRAKAKVSTPKVSGPKPAKAKIAIVPIEADKRWCEQCEMQIDAVEASGCKSRFCSLKKAG